MSTLYVLIPLGLVLVALAAWAFFWAVGSGQFDDLDTRGWWVLVDEQPRGGDGQEEEADGGGREP